MSCEFGKNLRVSIFGQSHSEAIGAVIDGLPSGYAVDLAAVQAFADRRRANGAISTARREADTIRIVSGLFEGKTCGAPLCALIENGDVRSADYDEIKFCPRPSHADFTSYEKYGFRDHRGGGHFSGRLTAPLCAAGGIAKQILNAYGIYAGAHVQRIKDVCDKAFDPVRVKKEDFAYPCDFPCLDEGAAERMRGVILSAKSECDSVGGVVECAVVGLPAGLGEPNFGGVENVLSSNLFGIPAVKGVEFGNGFAAASLFGSENNDPFEIEDGEVKTAKNDAGGVNGGITNGMPLIFRAAFKPTASVFKEQDSVDLENGVGRRLLIKGRHDPCVAVRAVPVVESVAYLTVLDLLLGAEKDKLNRGY